MSEYITYPKFLRKSQAVCFIGKSKDFDREKAESYANACGCGVFPKARLIVCVGDNYERTLFFQRAKVALVDGEDVIFTTAEHYQSLMDSLSPDESMLADEIESARERFFKRKAEKEEAEIISKKIKAEIGDEDVLNVLPFSTEPVDFCEKIFVLTGEFDVDKRDISLKLDLLGARTGTGVSQRTDYVVVGNRPSGGWIHGNFGRKIETALKLGSIPFLRESFLLSEMAECGIL